MMYSMKRTGDQQLSLVVQEDFVIFSNPHLLLREFEENDEKEEEKVEEEVEKKEEQDEIEEEEEQEEEEM